MERNGWVRGYMPSSDYGCVRFLISVAYSSRTAIDLTVIFHVQSYYRAMFVRVSECHSFVGVSFSEHRRPNIYGVHLWLLPLYIDAVAMMPVSLVVCGGSPLLKGSLSPLWEMFYTTMPIGPHSVSSGRIIWAVTLIHYNVLLTWTHVVPAIRVCTAKLLVMQ